MYSDRWPAFYEAQRYVSNLSHSEVDWKSMCLGSMSGFCHLSCALPGTGTPLLASLRLYWRHEMTNAVIIWCKKHLHKTVYQASWIFFADHISSFWESSSHQTPPSLETSNGPQSLQGLFQAYDREKKLGFAMSCMLAKAGTRMGLEALDEKPPFDLAEVSWDSDINCYIAKYVSASQVWISVFFSSVAAVAAVVSTRCSPRRSPTTRATGCAFALPRREA